MELKYQKGFSAHPTCTCVCVCVSLNKLKVVYISELLREDAGGRGDGEADC